MSYVIACFIIGAMLCFLIITAIKAYKFHRYPIHSRLELYPVPKEGNGRAEYGGSYFEEPEWWRKPRALNPGNETRDILGEMLLIRKLFQNNRSLWWASYAFHLGIYVMAGWTVLLLLATLWPNAVLVVLAGIAGGVGFALATLGAALLLIRRILDTTLRGYTTPQEYFNIILILLVLVSGIISWTLVASPFAVARDLLFFGGLSLSPVVLVHLILLGVMFVYIPLGKMSHYVGKFFAFHKVLWDNDPNQPGNPVNDRLIKATAAASVAAATSAASAAQTPLQEGWQAPHIVGNTAIPDDSDSGKE